MKNEACYQRAWASLVKTRDYCQDAGIKTARFWGNDILIVVKESLNRINDVDDSKFVLNKPAPFGVWLEEKSEEVGAR